MPFQPYPSRITAISPMQFKAHKFEASDLPEEDIPTAPQLTIEQLHLIVANEYQTIASRINRLTEDVIALFEGKWDDYQTCQVGYHNIQHALDVALATARMVVGWNKINPDKKISTKTFQAGLAAALFHDTGYLKDKNDRKGKGGKYSFTHVARSKILAESYLTSGKWSADLVKLVLGIIDVTEFGQEPDFSVLENEEQKLMARMVASADLIAQMADVHYIGRLHDLYAEFEEAYDTQGRENLESQDIYIFKSFQEMLDKTPDFYENFVLPRLRSFGRMDQYLVAYFGDGRNPYFENITANISGQLFNNRIQWQKLGDILHELGLVDWEVIQEALSRQKKKNATFPANLPRQAKAEATRKRIMSWLDSRLHDSTRLGDILMEMDAVEPKTLRTGILSQLLPEDLTKTLSREELLYLLQISLLVQNLYDDPWVFGQILEMTMELLHGEAGSLLIANPDKTELLIASHAGPRKNELEGKKISPDKGLSGWVFRHGRAAFVNKAVIEDHFWQTSSPDGAVISSILAVPLHINGQIIGVLEIINKKTGNFTEHDADIFTLLANVMACSLSMASKLHEDFSQS